MQLSANAVAERIYEIISIICPGSAPGRYLCHVGGRTLSADGQNDDELRGSYKVNLWEMKKNY